MVPSALRALTLQQTSPIRWTSCHHFFPLLAIFIYCTIKMYFSPLECCLLGTLHQTLYLLSHLFLLQTKIKKIVPNNSIQQLRNLHFFSPPAKSHKHTNQFSQQISQKQKFCVEPTQVRRERTLAKGRSRGQGKGWAGNGIFRCRAAHVNVDS